MGSPQVWAGEGEGGGGGGGGALRLLWTVECLGSRYNDLSFFTRNKKSKYFAGKTKGQEMWGENGSV